MLTTIQAKRARFWILGLALFLGGLLLAPAGMAQERGDDYDVSILSSTSGSRRHGTEIIVRVRTLQGKPAHGIPVRFLLDPAWHGDATIVPQQMTTEHGLARAWLHTDLIGRIGVTVRVGFGTVIKRTGVAFQAGGDGEPNL